MYQQFSDFNDKDEVISQTAAQAAEAETLDIIKLLLDRVEQSGRDSYINRRTIQPVLHPSRKNWFPLDARTAGDLNREMNKQAKDAFTVYRYRAIEDKIKINEWAKYSAALLARDGLTTAPKIFRHS